MLGEKSEAELLKCLEMKLATTSNYIFNENNPPIDFSIIFIQRRDSSIQTLRKDIKDQQLGGL